MPNAPIFFVVGFIVGILLVGVGLARWLLRDDADAKAAPRGYRGPIQGGATDPPRFGRPWTPLGIGWVLACLVLFVWVLVLLQVLPDSTKIIPLSFVALALAILL